MSWVANEVAGCRLKEQRLTQRLEVIVERLGAKPTASIRAACQGWGASESDVQSWAERLGGVLEEAMPHVFPT